MISLKRNKSILKVEEIFYNTEDKIDSNADIVLLKQSTVKVGGCKEFITLHIDLRKHFESIEEDFKKNTRYEIRRAKSKDNLEFKSIKPENNEQLAPYLDFYNGFAEEKNLTPGNKNLLQRLVEQKSLYITYIESEESFLVVHFYIVDEIRARLLYSASRFRDVSDNNIRNLIGRANRFLHNEDIILFKDMDYKILDLGGIAEDENNQETSQIDSFKKSFGGDRVVEYTGKYGRTLLGKLALLIG